MFERSRRVSLRPRAHYSHVIGRTTGSRARAETFTEYCPSFATSAVGSARKPPRRSARGATSRRAQQPQTAPAQSRGPELADNMLIREHHFECLRQTAEMPFSNRRQSRTPIYPLAIPRCAATDSARRLTSSRRRGGKGGLARRPRHDAVTQVTFTFLVGQDLRAGLEFLQCSAVAKAVPCREVPYRTQCTQCR